MQLSSNTKSMLIEFSICKTLTIFLDSYLMTNSIIHEHNILSSPYHFADTGNMIKQKTAEVSQLFFACYIS